MLWFKNCLELRARFLLLVLLIALPYTLTAARVTSGRSAEKLAQIAATMHVTAHYFGWPAFAVLFAGASIAVLGAPGARRQIHRAMRFTLSLPVTRTRLVLVRAAVGAVVYSALIAAVLAAVWVGSPALRAGATFPELLIYLFTAVAGAMTAYSAAVLGAAVLVDDGHIATGLLVLLPLWQLQSRVTFFAPPFSHVNWHYLAFTALVSAALLFAAVRVAERRQY